MTGYALVVSPAPPPLSAPASTHPVNNRLCRECLGLARLVTAETGSSTLLKTELGLFPLHLSPAPTQKIDPEKEGTKSRSAQSKRINIFYLAKVKYLNTTIWSVGLEVTIAKYTVYVQSDGNPKFIKDTNLQ